MLTSLALRNPLKWGAVLGEEGDELSMKTPPWDWTTSAIEPKQGYQIRHPSKKEGETKEKERIKEERQKERKNEGKRQKKLNKQNYIERNNTSDANLSADLWKQLLRSCSFSHRKKQWAQIELDIKLYRQRVGREMQDIWGFFHSFSLESKAWFNSLFR